MTLIDHDLAADFAATAEELLGSLDRSAAVRADLERDGWSATAWAAAAEAGWFDALLTEAAGGLGLSLREVGPILTAAGRHLFAGPLVEHVLAAPLAASAATGDARERLRATLDGSRRLAVVDEPAPVRFAEEADELLVLGDESVVLIATDAADVRIQERPGLDPGTRLCWVSAAGGEVVGGRPLASEIRAALRIGIACELAGIAEHALAISVAYAKHRHQFGRPIGSFQALQHILAEMARQSFGLTRLAIEAAAGPTEDVSLVAKAHAAVTARLVVEGALQVHGGIAFTVDHELSRYYKHLLFLFGYCGEPRDIHKALGRRLLDASADPWPAWR